MTDHQFLGIPTQADNTQIKNALIKKIADLDFEIDIETIFNYIHCSQRVAQKINTTTTNDQVLITEEYRETIKDFTTEEGYDTPQKLITHFGILYDNPSTRFNKLLWKSALESLQIYDKENLEVYVKPVIDFLNEKPFLKSDVLLLMIQNLPLQQFFDKDLFEDNEAFWEQYGLIHNLLKQGHLSLDLHAEEINTGELNTQQLDTFYNRLMMSTHYSQINKLPEAFNALSEGIPTEVIPLLFWQRKLNLLYKAVIVEKTENLSELFINTLKNALTAFPDDEHLLYVRAKYLFHFYTPEEFREEIINTLKKIPNHQKSLFLLGKCYMQLGVARAALIIFENLKKLNPLNMQYVTAAALASRKYIDFCISEHDPKDNDKQYYINMITTLIDKEMFDEVAVFATGAPKEDSDVKALLLYSKAVEEEIISGEKSKEKLIKALSYAKDKEIIQKIKQHYLKGNDWEDIKAEKEFILNYYKENPNNSNANYEMGMLYFAENEYEKAYDYLLKAKQIDPSNIENYYNLARVTSRVEIYSEAMEYASVYLQYNNYSVISNEVYCGSAYELKDYLTAHNTAKWILNICRDHEFIPRYFFYFTASLSHYIDTVENQYHNLSYLYDALELYDEYSKPATFWTDDNGSKSMYWAAIICFKMGDYDKAVEYLETILQNVQEYNWELMENCLFSLLPKCLYALQEFEKLIQVIENQSIKQLERKPFDPSIGPTALHISFSYFELGNHESRMQWALTCAYCYMNRDNPPVDWVDNHILNHFQICLELELHEHVILLGKAYIEFIKNIKDNHIWLAHNLANSCMALDRKEEALKYHGICIQFGDFISLEFQEVIDSQEFVNAFN